MVNNSDKNIYIYICFKSLQHLKNDSLNTQKNKKIKKKGGDFRRGLLGNCPECRRRWISGCADGPGCGTCCVSTVEASAAAAAGLEVT